MATPSAGSPKTMPFILLSVVTLILLIWALQQCGRGDDGSYAMIAEERARQTYIDSLNRSEREARIQARIDAEAESRAAAMLRARTQPMLGDSVIRPPLQEVVIEKITPLYSTINGLNVRSGPSLRNGVVARIPLYTEVTYLNERTDSLYEIDLGEITPKAPWVKIRLKDGKEGWVYGAGVSYYKFQLEGVVTD